MPVLKYNFFLDEMIAIHNKHIVLELQSQGHMSHIQSEPLLLLHPVPPRTHPDLIRPLPPSPSQLPVNSRSTPVYLQLNPGRHPDYDRMTSGYHPFISVLFWLNVPVFSGMLQLLSDFIWPFGR
ncbi:hypothetical protein K438DRAFT_2000202 [Mycena galopus ATCC 62051]|nr:hypothetical protein K438DRAFT_2000202 [Mycena galopus ATCC 62051]